MDLDYEQLAARILRPDRPRLAEARAAVAGITDAREAWEALATRSVIPPAWVDDPTRVYERIWSPRCARCGGRGTNTIDAPSGHMVLRCVDCRSVDVRPREVRGVCPPDVGSCVALASDVRGVLAAESIAREVWRGWSRGPVVWRFVDPPTAGTATGTGLRSYLARLPSAREADLWRLGYQSGEVHDDAIVLLAAAIADDAH